jgi:ligand-binding sensor domain-containing protein/signal transduction histidine kinase
MLKTIFIILIFFTFNAFSQPKGAKFKHLNTNHGLSQGFVISIEQDSKGFMWFGTQTGLNKYDGYKFTVYLHNPQDSTSIRDNRIPTLLTDSKGRFWVGTARGLDQFDVQRNTFVHFKPDLNISDILEDKKGNIWICSDKGLSLVDITNKSLISYQYSDKKNRPLRAICEDSKGNLWLGSEADGKGVFLFNPDQKSYKYYPFQKDANNSEGDSRVERFRIYEDHPSTASALAQFGNVARFQIYEDHFGVMWVSLNNGLYRFDNITNSFIKYRYQSNNQNSIEGDNVHSLVEDADGNLWIGHRNGISILDITRQKFSHYNYDLNQPDGLSENFITTIYKDNSDNLWIGSRNTGLNILFRTGSNFKRYAHELNNSQSLTNNVVKAIVKDKRGRLWLGTDGGGLNLFTEDGSFFSYMHDPKDPKSLPNNLILALYEDKEENIWVSTFNGALSKLNKEKGNFEHIFPNSSDSTSLTSASVSVMYEDSKGNFWIGTWFDGLFLFDKTTKKFKNYRPNANDAGSLTSWEVIEIYEDKRGNLWIGTVNGLNRFDYATQKFTHYFHEKNNKNSLSSSVINSIAEDKNGNLLIGTLEGLNLFDFQKSTFIAYSKKDGLASDIIQSALSDGQGNVWMSTLNGVCKFNPETKAYRNYSVIDGLQGAEFIRHSYYQSDDGEIFFGGNNGANCITPKLIKPNEFVPPIVLTDFKVFNKSVEIGSEASILQQHINYTKIIRLSYRESVFSFEFSALNFTNPEDNQYAYKLEGFDNNWTFIGNKNSVTYTNLNAGEYTFKVIGANNDGVWNKQGASLIIHVLPPWWETLWFRGLSILTIIMCATAFYSFRLRTIKRQNKKLSELVKERTKELVSKNARLVQSQKEIETQNEELRQGQEEISAQRDQVWKQNQKLEEAQFIIEKQNEEIKLRNENLEQEVESRTKELVAYNQQLEQFAFISAHNLRAPVATILGLGELLRLNPEDTRDKESVFEKIIFTARELDRVVRDLNTILEIKKNNISVISKIDLDEELTLVKVNIENEISETESEIKWDFSKAPVIHSVKPYVESILLNLLSNAIKYRHPYRKPIISITSEPYREYVCLTITDNGLGIETALYKDKLFGLYQRFHSHVEGKGLGLYLVKTQINALGGKIEIESKVDEGTTFRIYFKNV